MLPLARKDIIYNLVGIYDQRTSVDQSSKGMVRKKMNDISLELLRQYLDNVVYLNVLMTLLPW